ncbi:MAG: DUF975 family protein [Ruminococcaceae bacterium]|nr:DUF975 family protein [Oscillospiraceae bacterium]
MPSIKSIKKGARCALKHNYLRTVIVCLLLAFFAGAYSSILSGGGEDIVGFSVRTATNSDIIAAMVNQVAGDMDPPVVGALPEVSVPIEATRGLLAGLFNNITKSGSFVFGILNAINQFLLGGRVLNGVIILIGAAITFLYWMFIGNVLRVGECRFFLENRNYPGTRANRLLFIFKIRHWRKTAVIMLCRTLYIGLWFLTIVGGVVKYYAWRMVPYIAAENPEVTRKQAFKLSSAMMRGHKWRMFRLDLSFIGWYILSIFTLGFLSVLYVNPYKSACDAELYMALRDAARNNALPGYELMNDAWLAPETVWPTGTEYPLDKFPISENPAWRFVSFDYQRQYSFLSICLLFFVFCFIGWSWEVFVDFFNTGHFVNRGTLYGPWLPLYGVGGVLIILLLRRWADRPVIMFILAMALCGVVEYFTSWALEALTGKLWWEYNNYFLNIHGRVCLEALLAFGIAACLGVYLIAPACDHLFNKLSKELQVTIVVVLFAFFGVDLVYSFFISGPNPAAAIPIPAAQAAHPHSLFLKLR